MTYPEAQNPGRGGAIRRVTLWGMAVNIALAAVKFAAGTLGHSQAVVADAVHSLSDTATDLAVVIGSHYWDQPADKDHPHGHGRLETVVTLGLGFVLLSVGLGLAAHALKTLVPGAPRQAVPGWAAFAAAMLSVAAKESLYRWTVRIGRAIRSKALIANAWHHRSDALSSIPAALSVAGAAIQPDWVFLDAVGAVLVALLILQTSAKIVWSAFQDLIDAGASAEEVAQIAAVARAIQGVHSVHAIRTRSVGAGYALDLHVLVDGALSVRRGHAIAGQVKARLLDTGPDIVDVIIHIEPCPCDAACPLRQTRPNTQPD